MYKIFVPVIILMLLVSTAGNSRTKKSGSYHKRPTILHETKEIGPVFKFKNGEYFDFGSVKKDAVITHVFQFTNVGDKTLNIDNVTIPWNSATVKWDVEPILPGMKGHIYVTIDVKNLVGEFYREIYILSNANTPLQERKYALAVSGKIETESYKQHDDRVAGW